MSRRLNTADLSGIEIRVGAWISECASLLEIFRQERDPYLSFAVNLTQIPYEILDRDIHSENSEIKAKAKRYRQMAKPAQLGCIYRLGGGQMGRDKHGDEIKQGLWGYADGMGVEMTKEQAHEIVRVFRNSYPEIPQCWFNLENVVRDVLAEGTVRVKRNLGPDGCIKIDKFVFNCNEDLRTILRIQLPSGRYLHYMDATIEDTKMPWKDQTTGEDVYKPTLCYAGQDQTTKQWTSIVSHGGHIFQNIVQAVARDILAEKLLRFEEAGMPVILHVHDEGVTETDDDPFSPGLPEMEQIMSEPVDWAPGLPLASDGFETQYYRK